MEFIIEEDRMKGYAVYLQLKQMEGMPVRAIARKTGFHRNTVTKYLRMDDEEARQYFSHKVSRKSEFEQYRDFIKMAYKQDPEISMTRLYEMLTEKYPEIKAGYRSFTHHIKVNKLKKK